ncbi:hypothetical protein PR048_018873 [Dryococelus australis]|uniref:Uncharacterized protein n=1 Tax=Dryococelus australis TaxID=614101 RepID=A0ABQ9H1W6_9NEOP|nr:hypothetical protein PR048_018873 [Dryococelus australis]
MILQHALDFRPFDQAVGNDVTERYVFGRRSYHHKLVTKLVGDSAALRFRMRLASCKSLLRVEERVWKVISRSGDGFGLGLEGGSDYLAPSRRPPVWQLVNKTSSRGNLIIWQVSQLEKPSGLELGAPWRVLIRADLSCNEADKMARDLPLRPRLATLLGRLTDTCYSDDVHRCDDMLSQLSGRRVQQEERHARDLIRIICYHKLSLRYFNWVERNLSRFPQISPTLHCTQARRRTLADSAAVVPRRSGVDHLYLKVARDARLSALSHSLRRGPHVVFILEVGAVWNVLGDLCCSGKGSADDDDIPTWSMEKYELLSVSEVRATKCLSACAAASFMLSRSLRLTLQLYLQLSALAHAKETRDSDIQRKVFQSWDTESVLRNLGAHTTPVSSLRADPSSSPRARTARSAAWRNKSQLKKLPGTATPRQRETECERRSEEKNLRPPGKLTLLFTRLPSGLRLYLSSVSVRDSIHLPGSAARVAVISKPLTCRAQLTSSLSDRHTQGFPPGCVSSGIKGRWKREIPEKTRWPATSSNTIPTCENPGAAPLGIGYYEKNKYDNWREMLWLYEALWWNVAGCVTWFVILTSSATRDGSTACRKYCAVRERVGWGWLLKRGRKGGEGGGFDVTHFLSPPLLAPWRACFRPEER